MSGKLGNRIADSVSIAGGEVTYFQGGCRFKRASLQQPIQGLFHAPLLGRPAIIGTDKPGRLPLALSFVLSQEQWDHIGKNANPLRKLWQDRLVLQRVEEPSEIVHLDIEVDKAVAAKPGETIDPPNDYHKPIRISIESKVVVLLKCRVSGEVALRDRTLHNISLCLPNDSGPQQGSKTYPIAPHAIYAKRSWDSFGFIHATDLHVSRRLNGFRRKLIQADRAKGARCFNNCNDNMRDMIRYANSLHRRGMLDFILATGDLIDYVFEKRDHREGGNFAFLRDLILGRAPSPDPEGSENEELCVPIFAVLGNHDYRPNPYDLISKLDVGDLGPADLWPWGDETLETYDSFNLTKPEAKALQNNKIPKYDQPTAAKIVEPEKQVDAYYSNYISDRNSYALELGQHRLVVVDSRHDLGWLDGGAWDSLRYLFGALSEDERNFVQMNPDGEGFTTADIERLQDALAAAGQHGLVIVGVHGPPLNPKGNEHPHYFRETEHPTLDKKRRQVESYLRRRSPTGFYSHGAFEPSSIPIDPERVLVDWLRTGTPYFKTGGIGDLLDFGIAGGKTDEFLRLCVGTNAQRPVDLVLCGHTHKNAEYRLEWDAEDRFRFFTDFYTENPTVYYPSYDYYYERTLVNDVEIYAPIGDVRPIFIRVRDQAPLNQDPADIPDPETGERYRQLDVPPYSRPLNRASDVKAWWQVHRPLIIQTSGLGPIESSQRATNPKPTFQGFRVVSVENNIISKIQCVRLAELPDLERPVKPSAEPSSWLEAVLNMMMN